MFLIVLGFMSMLGGAVLANQKESVPIKRDDLIRILGELPDATPIREDMQRLGFRGANLDLAVKHNETFYRDQIIAGYIADQVLASVRNPTAAVVSEGLIWPAIAQGLGHLTTTELRYYYSVEQAMVNALPQRDCGLAVRNQMSYQRYSDAMSRVAARLETKALKEYYRIELKAARLGVQNRQVTLTDAELSRVETLLEQNMTTLIEAQPDAERLTEAISNLDRADNGRACRIGRMFYTAVMQMQGRDLRNGLLYLGLP